jgi:hypothetical protein
MRYSTRKHPEQVELARAFDQVHHWQNRLAERLERTLAYRAKMERERKRDD